MSYEKGKFETITLTEAKRLLGVSRGTLWRIIRRYNLQTFDDVLDQRVKLVRFTDIERILAEAERARRGQAA